jgi:hypothetical protein
VLAKIKARLKKILFGPAERQGSRSVFIHSPFKTGTTTIGAALVELGIGKADHGYHPELEKKYSNEIDTANSLAVSSPTYSEFEKQHGAEVSSLISALFAYASDYRVFGDFPFGHLRIHPFVKRLMVPNSGFIWIDRDEDAWLKSARDWQLAHPRIYPKAREHWARDPDSETSRLIRMKTEGLTEYRKLARQFPQDCLILKLETDFHWAFLCKFLDVPIPDTPFPNLNKASV